MRWKIKSYLVFTSFRYRILVFGVLPVLLIGLQFLPIGEWAAIRNIATVMVLIMIETVADNWYLGKLLPMVRTLVSIPAGVIRMKPGKYIISSTCGIFIWNFVFVGAGYLFGDRVFSLLGIA